MTKSDIREQIAKKHRAAIKAVIGKYGLRVAPWCIKAGISEGTLRNFLAGESDSLGANTLEMLAMAAGISIAELLGQEVHYKADDELMMKSAESILKAAKAKNAKLTRAQEMAYTVMLYNHAIEYKRQGQEVSPNEAMAALILKESIAS